jgi:hypothetical protein
MLSCIIVRGSHGVMYNSSPSLSPPTTECPHGRYFNSTIIHDNMASPDPLCLSQQNPTNPKVILSFSISRDSLHTWSNSTFVIHSDNLEGGLDTRLEFSVIKTYCRSRKKRDTYFQCPSEVIKVV